MGKPRIMVAILTTHERNGWPTKDLADWLSSLHDQSIGYTFCHNFVPAAGARNTVAGCFKDRGFDWILMLDNDMSPPGNLLDAIKNVPADAMVVAPKFFMWDETNLSLKLCWGWDEDAAGSGYAPPKDPVTGQVRVESKFYQLRKCGTGAIFICPEVFQKIPPPWFWYTYDAMGNQKVTEDINFCDKLHEHGMKIYGFGGLTVGHHHTVNLAALARLLYDVKQEPVASPVAEDGRVSLTRQEEVVSK